MSIKQLTENYYGGDIPTDATSAKEAAEWMKDVTLQLVHVLDWIEICQEVEGFTWDELCELDSGISNLWAYTLSACRCISAYKKH